MKGRKSSRDSRKLRSSRKLEREINDFEEVSSQSYGDSIDHQRKITHLSRRSSPKAPKEKNRSEEESFDYSVNYSSDGIHTVKKDQSKIKTKSSAKEDPNEVLSDYDYENFADYKQSKKRQKKRRRNENHTFESGPERDSSGKKSRSKSKRRKRLKEVDDTNKELPITEILKEHRTRYEEPEPLVELTTNTLYVQGRNGFSAVRIPGGGNEKSLQPLSDPGEGSRPIHVAIAFQKFWRSFGFVVQGLLGGMALLHLIFMETYFNDTEEFVSRYSALSEIYTSIFSFLIAFCIIAALDKFDLVRLGENHFHKISNNQMKSIVTIPLYIAALSFHQVTARVDDKLIIYRYNSSSVTFRGKAGAYDSRGNIDTSELKTWQRMTMAKDVLVVLSWIFVSVGNRKDMLLSHLEDTSKYTEDLTPAM